VITLCSVILLHWPDGLCDSHFAVDFDALKIRGRSLRSPSSGCGCSAHMWLRITKNDSLTGAMCVDIVHIVMSGHFLD
jgi:hypothetical protein